jgi:probable HAF family extracellular repeat protein
VTGPLKINDRRQVVGICADPGGALHGFLWDDGHFRTIDLPRASSTAVLAINNRGQMAGSYIDADGAYHGIVRERNGRVRTLPDAPGADPAMGHPAGRAQRSRAGCRGCLRRSRRVARIPAGARRAEPSSTAPGRSTHAR